MEFGLLLLHLILLGDATGDGATSLGDALGDGCHALLSQFGGISHRLKIPCRDFLNLFSLIFLER